MKKNSFFGPFHFNDFNETGILKKNAANIYKIKTDLGNTFEIPDLNEPGIYIWGNLFDIDNKGKLLFPTDCTSEYFKFNPKKHQFIPYYVGKTESSLFKRLTQHSDVRNISGKSDADKYIRFSFDYWKKFFVDSRYKRDSNNLMDIISNTKNSIIYHNDAKLLTTIFPQINIVSIGRNHPITAQLLYGNPLYDTLDLVVNGANNFWFCFCPVEENIVKTLGQIETQVFYSLKGKTTSKADKCPKVDKNSIEDKTNDAKIFKKIEFNDDSELVFPSDIFGGY
jgi:hypothetical protein